MEDNSKNIIKKCVRTVIFLLALLWAGTAYAFDIGNIWKYISFKDSTASGDSSQIVLATSTPIPTPTPIIPKYSLDKILPTAKVIILPTDYDTRTAGQCVGYVKYITGTDFTGNAINWKQYINLETPEVGSIVVMQVGKWGHVGIVVKVDGDKVTIRSRNWRQLWQISDDIFDLNDERILGYVKY